MKTVGTISRYLALEVALYTVLAALAATPVLLIPNVLDQVEGFSLDGVTPSDLATVLAWVLLLVASYLLPIAFVFGLLLAIGRLHGDGEILAMRACGMSVYAIARPVIAVGMVFSVLAGVISIGYEHRAWKEIEAVRRDVLARGAVLEPGRFQRFGDRTILAQSRQGDHLFGSVMISDLTVETNPLLIFAESAEYSFDPSTGRIRLALVDGDLRMTPYPSEDFDEHRISFERFEYEFAAPRLVGEHWRFRPNELSVGELRAVVARETPENGRIRLKYKHRRHYESHLHRLFAVPLTPLLFSIIGVPLALFGFVGSRAKGMLAALLVLGVYYALFIFFYDSARSGWISPAPAVWLPNAILGVSALSLLVLAGRSHR